jgi:hypothetical protein
MKVCQRYHSCYGRRTNCRAATRLIRKHKNPEIRDVLIIAMTASAIQGDREKCLESGMNNYLAKPVRAQTLKLLLESYLSKEEEVIPNLQAEANKLVKEALKEVAKDSVKEPTNGQTNGDVGQVKGELRPGGDGDTGVEKIPSRPTSIRVNTTQLWRPHDDANGKDESGLS